MCTPHQQIATTLSTAGRNSLSSRVTPQQSQFISAFDRIIATLGAHPIDDGYFWDSINSLERFVDHTDSFNNALRAAAFRRFASRYTQQQVNDNIWNAIVRRYTRMSQDHRGIVNVFLRDKVESSLTGQLAWDIHSQAVQMMRDAIRSLSNIADSPEQIGVWQRRISGLLTSRSERQRRAGRQLMDGLGINTSVDLSNANAVAQSIRTTVRLIRETLADFRIIAPQNLFRTVAQLPGAQESIVRSFGASQHSFIVHCVNLGASRGASQLSSDAWARAISGIVAGIAVGALTGGASVLVGFAAGASTSAVMGAPSLIEAIQAVDEARVGEASGVMNDQAIENAQSGRNWTAGLYVAGILIPNGAGSYVGHIMGEGVRSTTTSIATGAGLSVILEVIGALAPSDRDAAGFTELWEKLNSMTPEKRNSLSTAFNETLEQKGIPESARYAVMAAFAENNLSALDKTPAKAAQALANYCDTLDRQH